MLTPIILVVRLYYFCLGFSSKTTVSDSNPAPDGRGRSLCAASQLLIASIYSRIFSVPLGYSRSGYLRSGYSRSAFSGYYFTILIFFSAIGSLCLFSARQRLKQTHFSTIEVATACGLSPSRRTNQRSASGGKLFCACPFFIPPFYS